MEMHFDTQDTQSHFHIEDVVEIEVVVVMVRLWLHSLVLVGLLVDPCVADHCGLLWWWWWSTIG